MIIRIVGINVMIQGENVDLKGKKAKDESSRISSLNVCIENKKPEKTANGGGARMLRGQM